MNEKVFSEKDVVQMFHDMNNQFAENWHVKKKYWYKRIRKNKVSTISKGIELREILGFICKSDSSRYSTSAAKEPKPLGALGGEFKERKCGFPSEDFLEVSIKGNRILRENDIKNFFVIWAFMAYYKTLCSLHTCFIPATMFNTTVKFCERCVWEDGVFRYMEIEENQENLHGSGTGVML